MFRVSKYSHTIFKLAVEKTLLQVINDSRIVTSRLLRTSWVVSKEKTDEKTTSTSENKKKSLFITLIGIDGKLSTSTLEAATKLSKRRDLKLIKVSDYDTKRENPVYKLLSGAQVLGEDIEQKKKSKDTGHKSEKIISMTHRISEHDLKSKMLQIIKWLLKKHQVRVTISGSPENNLAESIYQKIETEMKPNGRVLQKRSSGSDLKFIIVPLNDDQTKKKEGDAKTD